MSKMQSVREKLRQACHQACAASQVTTFTDCVNCLIAFTNNPHSLDVSLNAIAFLHFCAMKLAERAIGAPPGGLCQPCRHLPLLCPRRDLGMPHSKLSCRR